MPEWFFFFVSRPWNVGLAGVEQFRLQKAEISHDGGPRHVCTQFLHHGEKLVSTTLSAIWFHGDGQQCHSLMKTNMAESMSRSLIHVVDAVLVMCFFEPLATACDRVGNATFFVDTVQRRLHVRTATEVIATGGHTARPYNCAHVKVFTNVFASAPIQLSTTFADCHFKCAAKPSLWIVPQSLFSASEFFVVSCAQQVVDRLGHARVAVCRLQAHVPSAFPSTHDVISAFGALDDSSFLQSDSYVPGVCRPVASRAEVSRVVQRIVFFCFRGCREAGLPH